MRLGTRGSDLALAQARLVAGHLVSTGVAEEVELVEITTTGDRGPGAAGPADKRRWIDTIEQAIRDSGVLAGAVGPAGYIVGYGIAETNLRLGHVVIADSVNPISITRNVLRAVSTPRRCSIRAAARSATPAPPEHVMRSPSIR